MTSPTHPPAPDGLPEWNLADRLRKIRRDRHLTQDEFASALGYKAVTYSAWEAGRTYPHNVVDLAGRIERTYGVPAAWVLGVLGGVERRGGHIPQQQQRSVFLRRWSDNPTFGDGNGRMAFAR